MKLFIPLFTFFLVFATLISSQQTKDQPGGTVGPTQGGNNGNTNQGGNTGNTNQGGNNGGTSEKDSTKPTETTGTPTSTNSGNSTQTSSAPPQSTTAAGENGSTIIMDQNGAIVIGGTNGVAPSGAACSGTGPWGRITYETPRNNYLAGDHFTLGKVIPFKWKFGDDLKVPPKNLTLQLNYKEKFFDLANLPAGATSYTWDQDAYQKKIGSEPLVSDKNYRLIIFDSAYGRTCNPPNGGLYPSFSQYFSLDRPSTLDTYIPPPSSALTLSSISTVQLLLISSLLFIIRFF